MKEKNASPQFLVLELMKILFEDLQSSKFLIEKNLNSHCGNYTEFFKINKCVKILWFLFYHLMLFFNVPFISLHQCLLKNIYKTQKY